MGDLLAGAEPAITVEDQIRCVEREIKMRSRVYPNWVERGRMTQGDADRELACMSAVLATLKLWAEMMGVESTAPELKGSKPLVLYFANDDGRREFVETVREAKPGMITRSVP